MTWAKTDRQRNLAISLGTHCQSFCIEEEEKKRYELWTEELKRVLHINQGEKISKGVRKDQQLRFGEFSAQIEKIVFAKKMSVKILCLSFYLHLR